MRLEAVILVVFKYQVTHLCRRSHVLTPEAVLCIGAVPMMSTTHSIGARQGNVPSPSWLYWLTFTILINGTALTAAHDEINEEFHVSDAHFLSSYWPISTWAMGGASASLVLLPIMEDFGVRYTFLSTFCFAIPQATAQSFAALCVTSFFEGGCVSVLASNAAGVIGNIWNGDIARTVPISLYITCLLTESSIGLVVGAVIV